jgi:hypothetical protein
MLQGAVATAGASIFHFGRYLMPLAPRNNMAKLIALYA